MEAWYFIAPSPLCDAKLALMANAPETGSLTPFLLRSDQCKKATFAALCTAAEDATTIKVTPNAFEKPCKTLHGKLALRPAARESGPILC
jgi:hypothetical protein